MRRLLVATLFALAWSAPAFAAGAPALTDSLKLDPAVRTGVLPNGLHYYVRHNARPEKRVALRLAVRIGSLAEADDQQGLAHFVEHMEFNGSKHFKPDELVRYLESIGLRFGADANAYTSFDETVYMLEVPTDRDTLLGRGLDVLSDWAGAATMTDVEIQKERGVVMEEWRLGRGAQERMLRKWFPVLFHGSRYAQRLPIGKPEIIQNGPADRLRDFYRDWYTPERMSVIAVGDVDPARMEALIRERFAPIPRARTPKPSPVAAIPPHDSTLIAIATDKEATNTVVQVVFKHPRQSHATVADYRRDMTDGLFVSMLNARLDERLHAPNAPYVYARSGSYPLVRTAEQFVMFAATADTGVVRGLDALGTELARIEQHGFLPSELDRAKRRTLASSDRAYAEREKTENDVLVSQLLSHVLTGGPAPGIEATHALDQALVPGISLDEVNAAMRAEVSHASRVVVVTAPEKARIPDEAQLRATLDGAASAPVAAWVDTLGSKPLMPPLASPGTIRSTRTLPEIGVTVLTLSNGVEVWLKPTDFKADQIVFSACALGGATEADTAAYYGAASSASLVGESGAGGFTSVDLGKLLAGRVASSGTSIDDYVRRASGSCRPEDLETALQLLTLQFTQPTVGAEDLRSFQDRVRTSLANRANSPEQVFDDALTVAVRSGFYADRPRTVADVDALRLEPMLAFYRAAFSNASEFRFYFAGTFKVETAGPLIARYLGALPARTGATPASLSRVATFPAGIQHVRVVKGVEPKSQAHVAWFADTGGDEMEMHRARAAASLLQDRLRQVLREDLGQTYGAGAWYDHVLPAKGYGSMNVSFGGSPANIDRMIETTLKEVARLRDQGPSADDVKREQEIERRELETSVRENPTWAGLMLNYNLYGWDPRRIAKRAERIELLTPAKLQETFKKYYPEKRYTVVTLVPEGTSAATGTTTP